MKRNEIIATAAFILLFCASVLAEGSTRMLTTQGSWVEVIGTSNIHNWTSRGEQIKGYLDFEQSLLKAAELEEIFELVSDTAVPELSVRIPVRSIRGKNKTMDNKTYQALGAEKYSDIVYKIKSIKMSKAPDKPGATFRVRTSGTLVVRGVSKVIEMELSAQRKDGRLTINGEVAMKMSDFKIKPPSVMFGMIKCYDDIRVRFQWVVIKKAK